MTQKPPHGSENSSKPEQYLMETLMSEALSMSNLTTSKDTRNAISSLASADGHTPSSLQDGLPTDPCGRDHAPASRSASQEKGKELRTNDTSGPYLPNSFKPASLQRCLENRLRQRLAGIGSPEYSLTWKEWDIQGQEPICALQAKLLPIRDSDFSGLPTPTVNSILEASDPVAEGRVRYLPSGRVRKSSKKGKEGSMNWSQDVLLRGYLPTPKLVLFCMGYPPEWSKCAERAMQSFPKSRRSLLPLSKTQLSDISKP